MPIMDNLINVLLIWASLIIINDIRCSKSILKFKGAPLAFFFLAIFFCTILYMGMQIVDIKIFIYMFLQLCFFTYSNKRKNFQEIKSEVNKISIIVVKFGTCLCIISLFLYFIGYCEVYTNNVMSMKLLVGRHPNSSLYGILANSNWTSFLCLTIVGLSFYLRKITYDKKFRIHSFIALITLFLTNSRGGFVGFMVFFFCLYTMYFLGELKHNKKHAVFSFILIPCSIILLVFGNIVVKKISGALYNYTNMNQIHSTAAKTSVTNKTNTVNTVTTISRDEKEQATSTNIRLDLLKAGLRVLKDNFIFGVGVAKMPENIYDKLPANSSVDSLKLASNTHNVYMQTAVVSGVIGFMIFFCFLVYNLFYIIIFVGTSRNTMTYPIGALLALLAAYLVINLVEADIFMSRNFMSSLFWIYFGYTVRMTQLTKAFQRGINK